MKKILPHLAHPDQTPRGVSIFGLDMPFLITSLLILLVGTFLVFTAVYGSPQFASIWLRHWLGLALGLFLAVFVILISPVIIQETSGILYIASLLFLLLVLALGTVVHGSKSWFSLGPIRFQPVEFAKIATVLFVSARAFYYFERTPYLSGLQKLKLLSFCVIPMMLVLMQNDFSSSLSFVCIIVGYSLTLEIFKPSTLLICALYGGLLYGLVLVHIIAGMKMTDVAGLSYRLESLGFGPGASLRSWIAWLATFLGAAFVIFQVLRSMFILPRSVSWVWFVVLGLILNSTVAFSWLGWKSLKNYQKARIVSFLLPKADALGFGYQVTQSKIAIGSGGFLGRGVLLGSQTALGFLPERHTDFAFATLAEAVGFVGSFSVLVLFGILFWRIFKFTEMARENFGRLVAVGFLALWAGEICINLACVLGLMPVLGIGLPFISYGGSRLVMNMLGLGILLSLTKRFYVYR